MAPSGELAEVYGGPIAWDNSMFGNIEKGLLINPDGPAVIAMHQQPGHLSELTGPGISSKHLVWSYSQIHLAALKLYAGLRNIGVQSGSTVVTLIPNRAEWALIFWTSTIFKLTLASLDFGALNEARSAELENFIRILKPAVVVVANDEGANAVDNVLYASDHSPSLKVRLDSNGDSTGWPTLIQVAQMASLIPGQESEILSAAREEDPERISWICFTSGTSSGKPKGCPQTVAGSTYALQGVSRYSNFNTRDRYLAITANFRIVALIMTFNAWHKGAAILMPGAAFDPEKVLDAIEREGASHCIVVPALLHALVNSPTFASRNVEAFRSVSLGGDIITKGLLVKAANAFPRATVFTSHGMSEGGGIFKWPFWDTVTEDIPYFGEISPLGVVSPGARIRIYDHERKCVASRGELGEVQYCAEQITHYLEDVAAYSFYNDAVGRWFKTGDLGLISEQGIVYIVGRIKDRIKRAGVPITPTALEDTIGTYIGAQVSVIGIKHPSLGQEPFAVVQSLGEKTEEQVKQRVLDLFGKDYSLRGVATMKQLGLDTFPLNATDKIMKLELQEIVERHLEERKSA